MQSITITDIARMSGVGVTTVSRAINDHPDISEKTKAKVMEVIRENNYIPNNSARNLKRSESKTIAVLIKGINNSFFNPMINVFEKEIKKKDYTFIFQRVNEDEDELDVAAEVIKEKRLTGIIFLGGKFIHSEERLKQITVPFVLSTIGMSKDVDTSMYSSVSVDDFAESYKLVDYLCKMGHRKIAIIAAPKDDQSIGYLRYKGYKAALKDNNINYEKNLVRYTKEAVEGYGMKNGYNLAKDLLDSKEEFTALYAISDSLAIGACKAILDRGKKVPEDYSLAGFDGLEIGHYYNPSITTIKQPVEKIAEESISLLFKLINNKIKYDHKTFEAELLVRDSTKAKN